MTYVLWLHEYSHDHRPRVGGKSSSLGEMMNAGLPVPPGFAVTVEAYHTMRQAHDLRGHVNDVLGQVDLNDVRGLEQASGHIRSMIEQVPLHDAVAAQVREAYDALCERCDSDTIPVAVRSSATSEDMPDASFAGEHDTFLWVRGADDVLGAMTRCWSSLFTARAMAYRHEMGYDHGLVEMSVAVQKMVHPKAAGVAFTLNPTDGDRSQVAIDSSWGFGEAVVGGEVTPDNFLVDKVLGEIVRRTVSAKDVEYRLTDHDTVEKVPVDAARVLAPSLTDDEIKAIARLARRAEKHYGIPQDVEWAVDRELPDGDNVILLQARPETVWSRRPRTPVASADGDLMASIVNTLVSPLHTRSSTGVEPG